MGLFTRRARPAPARLPLLLPRRDGTGWPDPAVARPSFEASTYVAGALRQAYEPRPSVLGELLVDALLPTVPEAVAAPAEDLPHLRKLLLTALRSGAGMAVVERASTASGPGELDPHVAGGLRQLQRELPALAPSLARTAAWCVLAGHYLGRQAPEDVPNALEALLAA